MPRQVAGLQRKSVRGLVVGTVAQAKPGHEQHNATRRDAGQTQFDRQHTAVGRVFDQKRTAEKKNDDAGLEYRVATEKPSQKPAEHPAQGILESPHGVPEQQARQSPQPFHRPSPDMCVKQTLKNPSNADFEHGCQSIQVLASDFRCVRTYSVFPQRRLFPGAAHRRGRSAQGVRRDGLRRPLRRNRDRDSRKQAAAQRPRHRRSVLAAEKRAP